MKIFFSLFFFLVFCITTFTASAQKMEELQRYRDLFRVVDSLTKTGKPFGIDTTTKMLVAELDKKHPTEYLSNATELLSANKFNDAAFLYYLGIFRYRFYNAANPDYKASEDGALAASLEYVIGEQINAFAKVNVDYFIALLRFTADYYKQVDYSFFPRKNNVAKYDELSKSFDDIIKDLMAHKKKIQLSWDDAKKKMLAGIDEDIEKDNKLSPEEKAKLKKDSE